MKSLKYILILLVTALFKSILFGISKPNKILLITNSQPPLSKPGIKANKPLNICVGQNVTLEAINQNHSIVSTFAGTGVAGFKNGPKIWPNSIVHRK